MRIALVTGSNGFVGKHLVPELRKRDYAVTGIDPTVNAPFERWLVRNDHTTWDLVVHLGANIVNVHDRMRLGVETYADIGLDLAMCQWASTHCKQFVAMSSCAVDFPKDPYGWTKQSLERFVQKMECKVTLLRPFSGYSEAQSMEYPFRAILERALYKEDPLTVWGGAQIRDWLHIDDLVAGILHMVEHAPDKQPIELGTGRGTTFFELATLFAEAVGYRPDIKGIAKEQGSPARVADTRTARDLGWCHKVTLPAGIERAVHNSRNWNI